MAYRGQAGGSGGGGGGGTTDQMISEFLAKNTPASGIYQARGASGGGSYSAMASSHYQRQQQPAVIAQKVVVAQASKSQRAAGIAIPASSSEVISSSQNIGASSSSTNAIGEKSSALGGYGAAIGAALGTYGAPSVGTGGPSVAGALGGGGAALGSKKTIGGSSTSESCSASSSFRIPREVRVELQVALRIGKQCQAAAFDHQQPAIGEILGLEVADGILEVTDCFSTDLQRDLWVAQTTMQARNRTDKEQEQKRKKEFARYSAKMLDFCIRVNGDCFTLGWFEAVKNFSYLDSSIVEKLVAQNEKNHTQSIFLALDCLRRDRGEFPLRAFCLSEEFLLKKKSRVSSNTNVNSSSSESMSIAARALQNNSIVEILVELPVYLKESVLAESLIASIMTNDINNNTPPIIIGGKSDSLLPLSVLEKVNSSDLRCPNTFGSSEFENGLLLLPQALDGLADETEKLIKFQKDASRIQQSLKRTLETKRAENEQQKYAGEEPLYLDEEFMIAQLEKKLDVPSLLKTRLSMQQINYAVDSLTQAAKENIAALQ